MKELKIETNVRLNASTFQKMEELRQLGFSPAAIMRKAIEQALEKTLEKAKRAGL
jgi:predicted DNA-binding protein